MYKYKLEIVFNHSGNIPNIFQISDNTETKRQELSAFLLGASVQKHLIASSTLE